MGLLGKQWKYMSEGNVHIVVQLVGTDDVVRLIKEDIKPIDLETIYNSVNFVNLVMLPLLSTVDCNLQEVIEISLEEMTELNRDLVQFRPENRRNKTVLSVYAIRTVNLTILSSRCEMNYCIEIKPKEGFLADSFKKYSRCYYCMKQLLKLNENLISRTSNYCPLDLFSGQKERMKLALLSLVNNPQNNFKVFQNGSLIFDDKSSHIAFDKIIKNMAVFYNINVFLDFLIEILLSDGNKSTITLNNSNEVFNPSEKNKCTKSNELKTNTFLHNLLHLQMLSESLNYNVDTYENLEYVPLIIRQLKYNNLDLKKEQDKESFIRACEPSHLALISAVFKDCSIMIQFSTDFEEGHSIVRVGERNIPFRVSVTDLEPKPSKTLAKRMKTESKLISMYEKFMDQQISAGNGKIQPHSETRAKQLEAWQNLIADYLKANKQSTIDIRESQNSPLFNNSSISRKLSQESILVILEDMAKNGRAAPVDKSKNVWEVYWHSLDEWGNMVYTWACNNGMNNSVCTLFELRESENTADQEFHCLDMNVLVKALKRLETKGRCELIEFDDNQGVKFF